MRTFFKIHLMEEVPWNPMDPDLANFLPLEEKLEQTSEEKYQDIKNEIMIQ